MYDLRVVVEEIRGFCDMPMRPGDYCELKGGRLYIPEGKYFCLWALHSIMPLLPVKQRRLAEDNDWIPNTFRVSCPDPDGMVIMRIEQIAPAGEQSPEQRQDPRPRLLVSPGVCSGCRACEQACSDQNRRKHDDGYGFLPPRIRVEADGGEGRSYPVVCRQCGVARCVQVCAQGALSRHPQTGAVLVDAGLCVRCGACVQACPFGAITVSPDTALPVICDLCGCDPACVKSCPTGALRFGRAGALMFESPDTCKP